MGGVGTPSRDDLADDDTNRGNAHSMSTGSNPEDMSLDELRDEVRTTREIVEEFAQEFSATPRQVNDEKGFRRPTSNRSRPSWTAPATTRSSSTLTRISSKRDPLLIELNKVEQRENR